MFVLGNLRTWLVNPDKSSFGKYLKAINDKVSGDVYKFHKEVANSTDPKIPDHVKHLAKFFLFTSGGWFKFKPDWRPRAKLQNWGIQVNTNAVSGVKYPWSGAGKYKPVRSQQKNGIRFSKNIYSANKKIDVNGL